MSSIGGTRSEEETRDYLAKNLQHWDRYGYGLWILRSRDDETLVGRSAIRHIDLGGQDEIEIAYVLLPQYWGCGLATEVAREMLDLAFSRLGINDLVAVTLPENRASRRVMEKAGGVYECDIDHAEQTHVLYRFRPENPVS